MGRVKADGGLEQRPFRALLDLMKLDTCWVKVCGAERVSTAGPPFLDAVPFARAIVNAAPDRVLWGTDWPHPNVGRFMPNDGDLVDLLAADRAGRKRSWAKLPVEQPRALSTISTRDPAVAIKLRFSMARRRRSIDLIFRARCARIVEARRRSRIAARNSCAARLSRSSSGPSPRCIAMSVTKRVTVRRHLNVFVNSDNVRDLDGVDTTLTPGTWSRSCRRSQEVEGGGSSHSHHRHQEGRVRRRCREAEAHASRCAGPSVPASPCTRR